MINNEFLYKNTEVLSVSDYYPFGMMMPERHWSSGEFRFGFNSKECDNEGMGGGGSTYDYGFRIYKAQIAKFLSVDPLFQSYPMLTPYQFASNMPIWAKDLDGLEALIVNKENNSLTFIANVYFVTRGQGSVDDPSLALATDNKIVKTSLELGGMSFRFELNYILVDESDNPLTYDKAVEMAKKYSITHTIKSGANEKTVTLSGSETGVVVASHDFRQGRSLRGEFYRIGFPSDEKEGRTLGDPQDKTFNLMLVLC